MRKLFFLFLFVLISQTGAFAQVENQFDLGTKAARTGDFQTALNHYQKSLGEDHSNKRLAQIQYNIGVCFYRLHRPEKAVSELQKAIEIRNDSEKSFYVLGMAYIDLKNWPEAEKAFRRSIELSRSRNGEVWFDLAFVFVEQKQYDEAFVCFQNAIKFGSRAAPASHNNLGVIYALKGDFAMAEKELILAAKLDFSGAESNLAVLRQMLETGENRINSMLAFKEK